MHWVGLRTPSTRLLALLGVGLFVRLAFIVLVAPAPVHDWFAPFMTFFLEQPGLDPWTTFLQTGAVKSFPYGIVMLAALTPLSTMAYLCNASAAAVGVGILLTLLLTDIIFLCLLRRLLPGKDSVLLIFWWLCPLVVTTNYWIGQLDIIPVCLLVGCFVCLKEKSYKASGFIMALALSAKFSMALALPLLLLYFSRNHRMRPYSSSFLWGFIPATLLLLGLPLLSSGYQSMTLGTSELARLFDLYLPLGSVKLYLTPIAYAFVVYAAWRTAFLNFDLLTAFTSLAIMTVVLSTPTPPGWQLWAWPFLVVHLAATRGTQRILGYAYGLCASASQILFWPPPIQINNLPMPQDNVYAVFLTILFSMGAVLMVGILRNGIRSNEMYRFGSRPISIAIAGDSGGGKDTLAESLIGLFGAENTAHISGDDYHHWDRNSTAWKMVTHLNPRANDLKRLFSDVSTILGGKRVTRRHYQHCDGHFSRPISEEPQHFFIASGLHTLISEAASTHFNLRIFLEMDDSLRVLFKCRRDMRKRGHSVEAIKASLERRKQDSLRYIAPQHRRADIVFVRRAIHPESLDLESDNTPPTILEIRMKRSLYHDELARQLISLCGLRIDMDSTTDMEEVILTVDGDIVAEDMAHIASRALPELEELLSVSPKWKEGAYGLMQLVILYHLAQTLKAQQ